MDFKNQIPLWKNKGTAPSKELEEGGFSPGYKPPASVFNWFWHIVSGGIQELQQKLSSQDENKLDKDQYASTEHAGVIKLYNRNGVNRSGLVVYEDGQAVVNTKTEHGVTRDGSGQIGINPATEEEITAGVNEYKPITPKTMNHAAKEASPEFAEADSREQISSGDKLSIILGKIKKWLADLKAVAFSGSYNDLSDKPTSMRNPNSLTLNLNGSATSYNGASSLRRSWYAPTSAGTAGYIPVSNGAGAPVWRQPNYYGVCTDSVSSSKASTFTYTVQIPNFYLVEGVSIKVKFTYPHTIFNSKNVYLNVSGTGNYPLIYAGSKPHGQNGTENGDQYDNIPNSWAAGEIVEFWYIDGKWTAANTEKVFNPQRIVVSKAYYYNSFYNMAKISDADFICHGSDDTEIIQKAINACAHGGTIFFTGGSYKITAPIVLSGAAEITFEGFSDNSGKGRNDSYGDVNLYFSKTGKFTISRDGSIRFKNLGLESYADGYIFLSESETMGCITFDNVGIYSTAWTGMDNTIIQVGTIYMRNSTFTLASSSVSQYICYSGIRCGYIEVDNCKISLQNLTSSTGADLNFIYSASKGGVIRNSILTNISSASSSYKGRVNFACQGISIENCKIDLSYNKDASIIHYTTDTSLKSIFCNNIVTYYGATILNFDVIADNVFINTYNTTSYSIQLLKSAVVNGNHFFGRLGLLCSGKIIFSNNMLEYTRHGTALPAGSVDSNNLVK